MANKHLVVIGAGPSGLIAAATAAKQGCAVTLVEKQPILAQKLRITGKGRCNITNGGDIPELIAQVNSNPSFLYSAFYSFTNDDVISLFHQLGVDTKQERGGRIFPASDSAKDVAEALVSYAKQSGVTIYKGAVRKLVIENQAIKGVLLADGKKLSADAVIVATGGKSYPRTGSTGDGYRFASQAGHHVVPPRPSLVPLETEEAFVKQLQGLSLKNIEIRVFWEGKKPVYKAFGELLFTHFGLSGPVILSASANLPDVGSTPYRLELDLKPALSAEQLDKRIQRDFAERSNKNCSNALDALLPQTFIPVALSLSGIDGTCKVHQVTKKQRADLVNVLKKCSFTITKTRPIEEAIITAGGVCTKEIDPSTMQSKLVSGLYFAGEVIDVDAYTGGYNLQIAFSTGFVAGKHAASV